MCFFRRKKKDKMKVQNEPVKAIVKTEEVIVTPKEEPKKASEPTPVITKVEEPITKTPKVEPVVVKAEEKPKVEPTVEKTVEKPKAVPSAEKVVEKPKTESTSGRYSGKYEIYPEAGGFKYRLKASNGEILIVSQAYASKAGAASGIETLKKNVEEGVFEFYTDKSNYTQFLLYTSNKARLIATGEFYESVARAQSASESVKKFFKNDKVINLDSISPEDMREELVELKPVEPAPNGKIEFEEVGGEVLFRLKASNGEVLFESNTYSTKASAVQGLEVIKKAIESGNFRVSKDKVGRFQFKLFASNKSLLLTGETYPNEENCLSALDSVRRFYQNAKIVE